LYDFLNNGIPLFARGALPYPLGVLRSTVLTKKSCFGFGHSPKLDAKYSTKGTKLDG